MKYNQSLLLKLINNQNKNKQIIDLHKIPRNQIMRNHFKEKSKKKIILLQNFKIKLINNNF